jgi:prepilin-type N-terminal cleavage/methylation domain-containing protein
MAPPMIRAVRINRRSSGFTLLEIVIVLAISAIVLAGAAGLMIFSSDERGLRDISGQIELLAKRARTTAIVRQTSYALEFREGIVRMLPLAVAGQREAKGADLESLSKNVDEDLQVRLKANMSLSIRRWNSSSWIKIEKNTGQIWRFDPDGLCEPITIRLTYNKSYEEDTYHPLTATIRDSQIEAR